MENIIHILLIEDDEDDHFFVSEMLSEIDTWQADLDWASSVESAFEKIQHNSYDLFLLDYNLGKYSGLDFIARLPKHQKQTPVVMLTGERERSRDMAAMQAGAMDYLIKGRIDADRLERSIRYALARKKVERQKDDFVATVNHELRTPITSIKGSLGIALHAYGEAIPEEVHEMLEVAVRNCERLIRIVNDLLDVQKVQSGKLELEVTPLDVDALIEQAVAANEGYAHAQGVSLFTASNIEAGTQIEGDEGRLLQVMANLLSNAIKYSPGGGVVTVNAEEAGGAVRIEIIDEGPGIPEEFRSSVFGRFEQASESKGKQGTSGLGLNIARSLVELHNGEIGFETEMGSGTTFYFTLPLMKTVASF